MHFNLAKDHRIETSSQRYLANIFGYSGLIITLILEYKKIWGIGTLVVARRCILNLPISLNPVARDSNGVCGSVKRNSQKGK